MNYAFEGNIRELKNVVEYSVNVASGSTIEPENLPAYILDQTISNTLPQAVSPETYQDIPDSPATPEPEKVYGNNETENDTWAGVQRRMIIDALRQANGKKAKAADILGMSRSTLWRKIKQYGIE